MERTHWYTDYVAWSQESLSMSPTEAASKEIPFSFKMVWCIVSTSTLTSRLKQTNMNKKFNLNLNRNETRPTQSPNNDSHSWQYLHGRITGIESSDIVVKMSLKRQETQSGTKRGRKKNEWKKQFDPSWYLPLFYIWKKPHHRSNALTGTCLISSREAIRSVEIFVDLHS